MEDGEEQAEYTRCRERLSKITPGKGCFLKVLGSYKRSGGYSEVDDSSPPKIAIAYLHRQKLIGLEKELQQYLLSHPDEYAPTKHKIESAPEKKFEYIIIVVIDKHYKPRKVLEITWGQFLEFRRWHKTMRAWNMSLTQDLIREAKIIFDNQ